MYIGYRITSSQIFAPFYICVTASGVPGIRFYFIDGGWIIRIMDQVGPFVRLQIL